MPWNVSIVALLGLPMAAQLFENELLLTAGSQFLLCHPPRGPCIDKTPIRGNASGTAQTHSKETGQISIRRQSRHSEEALHFRIRLWVGEEIVYFLHSGNELSGTVGRCSSADDIIVTPVAYGGFSHSTRGYGSKDDVWVEDFHVS